MILCLIPSVQALTSPAVCSLQSLLNRIFNYAVWQYGVGRTVSDVHVFNVKLKPTNYLNNFFWYFLSRTKAYFKSEVICFKTLS